MSIQDKIEKALRLNNVCDERIVTIATDRTVNFSIHLFKLLVFLLCNFFLVHKMTEEEQYQFIMKNLNVIFDIVTTELEMELHNFTILYDEELADVVELHNKDECWLVLIIQGKVNKKLEDIGGK